MRVLITAGNTQVPIDRVRSLTNIFTGRTGAGLAVHAHDLGHEVVLLTSHPEVVRELRGQLGALPHWQVRVYRTFDDLVQLLESALQRETFDLVVHSAAVSDFLVDGVYAPATGTRYDSQTGTWASTSHKPTLVSRAAAKVKSDEAEIWLRLVRAPKLIDRMRKDWRFDGILVKFKLEVGMDEAQLEKVAEASRLFSEADLMVANTLEGAEAWAILGPVRGAYSRVSRAELARRLFEAVERLRRERGLG